MTDGTGPDGARVALVTGAARGMGAEVAVQLAGAGWRVLALDACADDDAVPYPLARPADLADVVGRGAGRIVPVVADVRDAGALRAAAGRAEAEFGGLDAAVAAAGVIAGGTVLWRTPDAVRDVLWDVCVTGVWNTAAAVVPVMLRRPAPRTGRFVAVASAAGQRGLLHLAAYSAAKHAVVGLVRALAQDLAGTGVTASAVSPGSTDTAMLRATAALYGLDGTAPLVEGMPLGRAVGAAEVARAICWLCTPEAALFTGAVLAADGGFTA